MSRMRTHWEAEERSFPVSRTVRPVTHTADAAVKSASTSFRGRLPALHNRKSTVPPAIIARKPRTIFLSTSSDVKVRNTMGSTALSFLSSFVPYQDLEGCRRSLFVEYSGSMILQPLLRIALCRGPFSRKDRNPLCSVKYGGMIRKDQKKFPAATD